MLFKTYFKIKLINFDDTFCLVYSNLHILIGEKGRYENFFAGILGISYPEQMAQSQRAHLALVLFSS